jgi:EGF domain
MDLIVQVQKIIILKIIIITKNITSHLIYKYSFQALTVNNFIFLDIDECTSGNATCSQFANCTNTEGGYNCSCNYGFTGDGFNCTGTKNK